MVRANDNADIARPAGIPPEDKKSQTKWWERGADRRRAQQEQAIQQRRLGRLTLLGIHPDGLTGRLRLVLTVGCYGDFRFTRDILASGAAHDRVEQALETLEELGAHCDCEVFRALGELPRGILWHKLPLAPPTPDLDAPAGRNTW